MPRQPLLHALLAGLALGACDEVVVGPGGDVASVVVAPATGSLLVGDTLRLVAAALDANGENVLTQRIEWATGDPSVATVDRGGLVRGVGPGQTFLYAASGSHADSAGLAVIAPLRAARLSLGGDFSCALGTQGAGYCWGSNFYGNLGIGLVGGSVPRPMPLAGAHTWSSLAAASPYGSHACGLAGGAGYCWGSNWNGQLGDGTSAHRITPTRIMSALTMTSIATGGSSSCGIVAAGVHCWGSGFIGGFAGPPALVSLDLGDSYACGLSANGTAWCWGANYSGQLGDGTTNFQTAPVAVAGGLRFTALEAGYQFSCGVVIAGEAWCWGENYSGQLGDGGPGGSLVPVPVSGGHRFTTLTAGAAHACGLTGQGDAWCWGDNYVGQLGDGTTIVPTGPVAVAGGHRFASIAAGGAHTCAIAVTGVVYCWGANFYGQLGDNTYVNRHQPVVVWAP